MEDKKWYLYRHPETNMELRFDERNPKAEEDGYKLLKVEIVSVDEKAMRVGGH